MGLVPAVGAYERAFMVKVYRQNINNWAFDLILVLTMGKGIMVSAGRGGIRGVGEWIDECV